MFFKILKITNSDARRLRNSLVNKNFLNIVNDYALLCKDLEFFEKNSFHLADMENMPSFEKDLGSYISPEYSVSSDYFTTHSEFLNIDYTNSQKRKEEKNLVFGVGSELNSKFDTLSGISFFVLDKNIDNIMFFEGPFPNQARFTYPYTEKKLIIKLANFFYNRRSLYKKIYNILLNNIEEVATKSNKEFAYDLALFFSANRPIQYIPDFEIKKTKISDVTFQNFWPRGTSKTLGNTSCYLQNKEANGSKIFYKLKIEVNIDEGNELFFAANEERLSTPPNNGKSYSSLEEFILDKTNNFLKQIIASSNFANDISETVKARLLLENI